MSALMSDLSHHYEHVVEVAHFPEGKTIWTVDDRCRNEFAKAYSYLLDNEYTPCDVSLNKANIISALVERYGGRGIGTNGGGARTVNIGESQVKGVGANCLVGKRLDANHSYGGQDIYSAISEIVMTHFLKRVTPLGAADIYGLISVSEGSGIYLDGQPCWSVLLVREKCLRPAHLIHAPYFDPKMILSGEFPTEEVRVRRLYRTIHRELGQESFISILKEYLKSTAQQFAFARMAKIFHGAITESNICFDGRWIDVGLTGHVPAGKNWTKQSDFNTEPYIARDFINQCGYNYAKYNRVDFHVKPLVNYYVEQFKLYQQVYSGYLFGVDARLIADNFSSCRNVLSRFSDRVENLIMSESDERYEENAYPWIEDPFEVALVECWRVIAKGRVLDNDKSLSASFKNLLNKLGLYDRRILIKTCIHSLKRVIASKYFYAYNTVLDVEKTGSHKLVEGADSYLKSRFELIDWIFEDVTEDTVTLYKNQDCLITYSVKDAQFKYLNDQQCTVLNSVLDINHLLDKNADMSKSCNYDFGEYLDSLVSVLSLFEGA